MNLTISKADAHVNRDTRSTLNPLSKIYVWPEGETILENLSERRRRPIKLFRTVLAAAITSAMPEIDRDEAERLAKTARWSRQAGCGCGCSPGFRLDRGLRNASYQVVDIHVTVAATVLPEPTVSELIQSGTVCGTCADEGRRKCDCYAMLESA